jgi:hypothetical protein
MGATALPVGLLVGITSSLTRRWSAFAGTVAGGGLERLVVRSIWLGAVLAAGGGAGGVVGDAAGVGHADLAGGGEGAQGLAGFVAQQPARASGAPALAGDQVVEVAGGLPQHLVALPTPALARPAGAGDSCGLGLQDRAAVGMAGLGWPDRRRRRRAFGRPWRQPLPQRGWDLPERGVELAARVHW